MAETNLLVLAREFKKLREEVKKVLLMPKGDQGIQGEKGEKGDKGDAGPQGFPGRDGKDGVNGFNGKDGRDGVDGKDGKDGKDGVSVVDAKIDFDNSLVLTLSNGDEIDCGVIAPALKDTVVATLKQTSEGGGGGASVTVSDTAPTTPAEGDLWLNSTNSTLYVYVGTSWIVSSPSSATLVNLILMGL